ncbi:MAG: hypothetical protein IAF38_16290 [Bacteroidia bacterium]|nr:hypothetical protein [Bacteroidia bacterium]
MNTTEVSDIAKKYQFPVLYSKRAVFWFAFLFTSIAGGILLSINLKRQGKEKGILPVMLFSVLFSSGIFALGEIAPANFPSGLFYLSYFIGAAMLSNFFWKKYLADMQYTANPIGKALIICIIFTIPILIWAFWDLFNSL